MEYNAERNYEDIGLTEILDDTIVEFAIYEECKGLFVNQEDLLLEWDFNALNSLSFRKLYDFFCDTIFKGLPITKKKLRDTIADYEQHIIQIVSEAYANETTDSQVTYNERYMLTSMDKNYRLMRDIVTTSEDFIKNEDGLFTKKVYNDKNELLGLAGTLPPPPDSENNLVKVDDEIIEKQTIWYNLVRDTVDKYDELTADIFDLICYLWMTRKKTPNGYIKFHCDLALILKEIKKVSTHGTEYEYRKEDRYAIMQRVSAVTNIWVHLDTSYIKQVEDNDEALKIIRDLEILKYNTMFEVGEKSIARDRRTGRTLGIYELEIRPTKLLLPFLEGSVAKSLCAMDVAVFSFNHYSQREHKRMVRYLSMVFKARKRQDQPLTVQSILKIMRIAEGYKGDNLRKRFEQVLNDLENAGVIEGWEYVEINEERFKKRFAYVEYWPQLKVKITPTDERTLANRYQNILNRLENSSATISTQPITSEQSLPVPEPEAEITEFTEESLSPEVLQKAIEKRGISIRKVSGETGISYTTLLRYFKGQSKKLKKDNGQKLLEWLNEQ